jgi:F0F1-type ATP synthase membrane subunit b/b'
MKYNQAMLTMLFGFTLGLFIWWVFLRDRINRWFDYRKARIRRRVRHN